MIRLKFTTHAQDMIQHRSVSVDHIKAAIKEPDLTGPVGDGKVMALKQVDEARKIKVIYCDDGVLRGTRDYLIVTAYYITTPEEHGD